MSDRDKQANAPARGFTNDGKVSSEIVNDSYGTVDPADSTGLDIQPDAVGSPDAGPNSGSDRDLEGQLDTDTTPATSPVERKPEAKKH